jgi:hypothetical protein
MSQHCRSIESKLRPFERSSGPQTLAEPVGAFSNTEPFKTAPPNHVANITCLHRFSAMADPQHISRTLTHEQWADLTDIKVENLGKLCLEWKAMRLTGFHVVAGERNRKT